MFNQIFNRQNTINLLDPADLAANRQGQITETQKKRLAQSMWQPLMLTSLIILLVFIPLLLLNASLFFNTNRAPGSSLPFLLIPIILIMLIVFGFLASASGLLRRAPAINRDLRNQAVRQTSGELAFERKKGYYIQAGERQLLLPPSRNTGGLLPGQHYAIYYLDESEVVLSAEQFGAINEQAVKTSLRHILAQANNFTEETLQANQRGEIPSEQRNHLLITKTAPGLVLLPITLVMLGPMLFLNTTKNLSFSLADLAPFLIILLVFGGIAIFGIIFMARYLMDIFSAKIEQVTAPARKHSEVRSSGRSSHTYYYYIINELKFQVKHTAYNALIDGLTYRAYYLPRTKTLLSIEPIDVPDNY